MTLIARLRTPEPIYVGDALLSVEKKNRPRINIPAGENINQRLTSAASFHISGLRQKVCILRDNCVVAWAGNMLQARRLCRRIEDALNDGATSHEHIRGAIEQEDISDRNQVSVLGSIVTEAVHNGKDSAFVSHFSYGQCRTLNADGIEGKVTGTGADAFSHLFPQLSAKLPKSRDDRETAYLCVIALQGLLAGDDLTRGVNLGQAWGGAFEAAHRLDLRFRKIDDILHLQGELKSNPSGRPSLLLSPNMMAYQYVDEHLLVTRLTIGDSGASIRKFIVPPLIAARRFDPKVIPATSFHHNILACHISGGDVVPGAIVQSIRLNTPDSEIVRAEPTANGIDIAIHSSLGEWLTTAVQESTGIELV